MKTTSTGIDPYVSLYETEQKSCIQVRLTFMLSVRRAGVKLQRWDPADKFRFFSFFVHSRCDEGDSGWYEADGS